MAVKRFTTSSSHDPTITQRTRTVLYEAGQYELVNEAIIDGMRDIEQMARSGLSDHDKRILMLEDANRQRFTESGIWTIVKAKLDQEAVDWMKWAVRAGLCGLGAALLSLIAVIGRLAWKGLNV